MAGRGPVWLWQHNPLQGAEPVSSEPIGFSAIPAWDEDDHAEALECYVRSLTVVGDPPLPKPQSGESARSFFERHFVPHRIMGPAGLLTAYFEPVLRGSRRRSKVFNVPVYRRPPDLELLPAGHPLTGMNLTAGRVVNGSFEPYDTRAQIRAGSLEGKGLDILYLDDAIDAFVMHVQGSGIVQLDDGTAVRLAFDGKNGHPYTSIAKSLVARGALTLKDAHLEGMIAWLRASTDAEAVLDENRSYIFFKEEQESAEAHAGSLGVPLTKGRSLAADPLFHRLGTPIWVVAPELSFEGRPFRRLMIAQDTGSAIKGPQRGDVFAGQGAEAGRVAGHVRHACTFIALRPRTT